MRLWHQELLTILPTNQLSGQHRECCALRGKGWGKPHRDVNYVFEQDFNKLVAYHIAVMDEMKRRGNWPGLDLIWYDPQYRGKILGHVDTVIGSYSGSGNIYDHHDSNYYTECVLNLRAKLDIKYNKFVNEYGENHKRTIDVKKDFLNFS